MHNDAPNPFPNDSLVLVWYPPVDANDADRTSWAWLPGTIISRVAPDEWYVAIEAPELAEPNPDAPNGDAPENLIHPACYRDASELRAVPAGEWGEIREAFSCD
ncbi:MAG TPA: hypothetical protein VH912_27515 [Streptosporangiaceae bacterium]